MPNDSGELHKKLFDFISDDTGIKVEKLELGSSLFHDLGVDGEDALELIGAFSKKFNVDVTSFPLAEYFGNEGTMSPFVLVRRLLTGRSTESKKKLTINDLIEAIKLGYLREQNK